MVAQPQQFGFGAGALIGTPVGIVGAAPVRFGSLQDCSVEFSGDIKMLYGAGQFADDLARGKVKIEGKAKFANIVSSVYASLYFGTVAAAGQDAFADGEAAIVPAAAPYTVNSANAAHWSADMGVVYAATGLALTPVAAAPAAGQYSVAAGVYTFAAADEGAALQISYIYSTTTGVKLPITQQTMGTTPVFQMALVGKFRGGNTILRLNYCVSSKLSLPTKQDDFWIQDFDFSASVDVSGNVGSLSMPS